MKWIHLTHEYFACIDDEDYEKVSQYMWRNLLKGYGRCDELGDITLHEFLIGKAPIEHEIDHLNRAPWDNRKCNLQIIPTWENVKNKGIPKTPPFPSEEEMELAKKQRHDLKYGEKYTAIRSVKKRGHHKHQANDHVKVKVVDDLGNVFDSIRAAAMFYDIKSPNCISLCCKGKLRQTHGRTWKYL